MRQRGEVERDQLALGRGNVERSLVDGGRREQQAFSLHLPDHAPRVAVQASHRSWPLRDDDCLVRRRGRPVQRAHEALFPPHRASIDVESEDAVGPYREVDDPMGHYWRGCLGPLEREGPRGTLRSRRPSGRGERLRRVVTRHCPSPRRCGGASRGARFRQRGVQSRRVGRQPKSDEDCQRERDPDRKVAPPLPQTAHPRAQHDVRTGLLHRIARRPALAAVVRAGRVRGQADRTGPLILRNSAAHTTAVVSAASSARQEPRPQAFIPYRDAVGPAGRAVRRPAPSN